MGGERAIRRLIDGAATVIRGKTTFLEFAAAALLAGGHLLLEDNPGLGKTTVAKALARLIGGEGDEDAAPAAAAPAAAPAAALAFKRIQFTPDLLPYDITGVDVFDPETRGFRFVPGPVLANLVLADEINRATPKVQSALLEVMAEGQVTVGAATHRPPQPFFVIATENPVESEGTFPLPAAQLDRFMMRLSLGYPDRDAELAILEDNPAERALAALTPVISRDEFLAEQRAAAGVFCHPALREAVTDIVRDTRSHESVILGASPRAGIQYMKAVRALAWVRGRDYCVDEDVAALAVPVLAHRVRTIDTRGETRPGAAALIREICLARLQGVRAG